MRGSFCINASIFWALHALMFALSVFGLLVMICPMQCSAEAFVRAVSWRP